MPGPSITAMSPSGIGTTTSNTAAASRAAGIIAGCLGRIQIGSRSVRFCIVGAEAKFGARAQFRRMISRGCGKLRYHMRQTRQ